MKYFESKTSSGAIQINDDYKNLYLSRKIPVSAGTGNGEFQEDEFLAGIGNGTNSINGMCLNKIGGYEYKLNNTSTQAYIFIFSNHPKSQGNCGLQVFNSNGEIIFDSNAKQAIVEGYGTLGSNSNKGNLILCCGGHTIQAQKKVTTSTGVNETTRLENEYQYVPGSWQWVDGKYQYVEGGFEYVQVWNKYYSAWATITVQFKKETYNICLENGYARQMLVSSENNTTTQNGTFPEVKGDPSGTNSQAKSWASSWISNAGLQDGDKNYSQSVYAYSCIILDGSFL